MHDIVPNFINLDAITILYLFGVGFVGGLVSGFIGSGGAFVLTPGMMSLGVPGLMAVASNMCHKFPKALVGSLKRAKYGQVDVKLGIVLGISAEAGVLYGAQIQENIKKAFGDDKIDMPRIAKAIAAYERTVVSGDSPYDRYQAGDKDALSAAAVRGLELFNGKANCKACHTGFNFTDESYHNLGVGTDKQNPDEGRFIVTKKEEDWGAFKTPTLREVARTAPYMHDGSLKTIEEVVDFYTRGGEIAYFDQQPVEVHSLISACLDAYRATRELSWYHTADLAFEWFLGRNALGIPATYGASDPMTPLPCGARVGNGG